ncbi:cysteine sulfinic acid decarboxylase isoform X4 [Scophthalmus maximus]|uniref:cysteine sulfinic acid decarboxylase isoform X4 n=1 Tax=Scophthalmus maximus TaxID=52904 RepID=UPI001FA822C3|nr:cysteine sulfinic acid decarboxylase isoform X4 [Scophthalmus maximus]
MSCQSSYNNCVGGKTTTAAEKQTSHRDLNEPLIDHIEGQLFLNETFKIIVEEVLRKGTDVKEKVCEWKEPEELALLLDLELRATGEPQHSLLQRVKDVAKYSVKTSHPRFYNQQFAGVDYHSLAGRFLTEALNTNLFTYEVAPAFVLMESEVLRGLRQMVGWTEGDGIFCPGGSTSNIYAMNLARYRFFPEVKSQGLWGLPRLTIFTSPESHYSVKKGAAFLGLGTDNVILVKVDDGGHMIPRDLDEKIMLAKSQGAVPFLVSCTAGTTVQGAFDPLDLIAGVCEKHKLWMHIDAAWGGSVLFSKQHRQLMKGADRYLVEQMKKREGFHLLSEPEFVNVCFWYIPPSLRGKEGNADYQERLAKVAPIIKERMVKQGTMMVGYQPLGNRVNFFRVIVFSPLVSQKDMDFFLDEIERLGNDL